LSTSPLRNGRQDSLHTSWSKKLDSEVRLWHNAASMSWTFHLAAYAAFGLIMLGFSTYAVDLAHKSMLLANAHQVRTSLELYYYDHDAYPATLSDLVPQYLEVPAGAEIQRLKYAQTAAGASYNLEARN